MSRSTSTRLAVALALAGVVVAATFLQPGAAALPAGDAPDAAIAWLVGEADDGIYSNLGAPDWGLTADAALAAAAAGSAQVAATHTTDQLAANATTIITFGVTDVRSAGRLAKLLLVAEVMGRDPGSFGGWDLPVELLATMVDDPTSEQLGRLSDVGTTDASNVYGHALGVLALTRAGGAPAEAVAFLLGQQCPGGGFRAFVTSTPTCTNAALGDTDTTAIAIQALLAVGGPTPNAAASTGGDFIEAQQGVDGAISGSGPTAGANANSSGVGGQALRALGRTAAADAASTYVRSMQIGCDAPAAAGDAGAIAYNAAALGAATTSGIAAGARDQFRRTTAQGVLALGAAPFTTLSIEGAAAEPVPAVCETTSTTTTTTAPTTTAPGAGDGGEAATTTTSAPTTTPVAPVTGTPTTTAAPVSGTDDAGLPPSGADAGSTDVSSASVSPDGTTAPTDDEPASGLAFTGVAGASSVTGALVAIAAGAMMLAVRRHRRGR